MAQKIFGALCVNSKYTSGD